MRDKKTSERVEDSFGPGRRSRGCDFGLLVRPALEELRESRGGGAALQLTHAVKMVQQ